MSINTLRQRWQARSGRQSWQLGLRRLLAGKLYLGLVSILLAALITSGCGGSSSAPATSTGTGGLYTLISDTPSCDVLGFALFLTEVDLHRQGSSSTSKLTVYPTSISPFAPTVEMTELRDTSAIANLTSINAGTYDQAILTVTVDSASIYDPSATPPASSLTTNITSTNITVNIQPPLVVTKGAVNVLQLDFNLPQSLEVDSQGQLTGNVTPVFTARPITLSATSGFTDLGVLEGFVTSVTNTSTGTGFTGAFALQTLSGNGPALSVNLTDTTQLLGVDRLDQMPTGTFVEVDGYIDGNGNYVAKSAQVEGRSDISQQNLAYLGQVLTVTRDSNGNATQFAMLVHHTEPADLVNIKTNQLVTVNVSPSTTYTPYSLSSDLSSLASGGNLTFGAQTLAPGQEIVVHGIYTVPATGLVSVAADQIYQRMQSVQGDFSSLIQAGSDDKTGAFHFLPCSGLVAGTPFTVVTDAQTQFVNAIGLSSLSPTTPLLARGLSFRDVLGGTVNGVPVPAGTMVVLANHVRQF